MSSSPTRSDHRESFSRNLSLSSWGQEDDYDEDDNDGDDYDDDEH